MRTPKYPCRNYLPNSEGDICLRFTDAITEEHSRPDCLCILYIPVMHKKTDDMSIAWKKHMKVMAREKMELEST